MNRLRVVLADDHNLVRAGLRSLLSRIADVEIAAETADGHETCRAIEEHRPDLALLDVALPGLNGLEVAERAKQTNRHMRVLMLSMYSDPEYVYRALDAGADGYLLKEADLAELELAVRAVQRGEMYLSPGISRTVVNEYLERRPKDGGFERLTPRQREVLQLVAEGLSTKEIARRLDLGVRTVETHRAQVMERLDIHDIAGLVRYAIRTGLVRIDQ